MREGLARVRNNAVSDFEAVDVGLIFRIAAEGVADGVGCETEKSQKQEKHGERSPIVEGADAPGSARAREKPADGAVARVEEKENHSGEEQRPLPDVTQDVVSQIMMRLEAPKPLTEALVATVLSLAFIQNMRSGETSWPAQRVTRWSSGTS